jgi:hypothetical protein
MHMQGPPFVNVADNVSI